MVSVRILPSSTSLRIERAIDLGAEGRHLAPVRIGAAALAGVESALAMFSEMMRMRPACARRPEAAMAMVLRKSTSVSFD